MDCVALESVEIPSSVRLIGERAFDGCAALKSVLILGPIKTIEPYTFNNCVALESVKIPNSVISIGVGAFGNCNTLEYVKIPSSLDKIGVGAFRRCRALKKIEIPGSIRSIGNSAFYGCRALLQVNIRRGNESTEISVGISAFCKCESLVDVTMHLDQVASIGVNVFKDCNANLIIDLGQVTDGVVERFPEMNGVRRTARVEHYLPDYAGHCIVRCVWPASTKEFKGNQYEATEPGPATLVDGTGIEAPLLLQTLGGDPYPVYGCWGKNPVAHPDFESLVAEQYPDALGNKESWDVLLPNTDVATHTLDLEAVGNMIVRGEIDLSEPVLLVWTEDDDSDNELGVEDANELNRPDSDNESGSPIQGAEAPNRIDKDSAAPIASELERTQQLCDMCC
jgi:hypothetical protein